jgi:tetratricopeptide (TPR) repeat protein
MDIDAFRQMVAKNPKGFLGRYGLGNKILQQGSNLEEAVEHLTVATQLDPTHVASHLGLGRALVSLGRKDEAKPVLVGLPRHRNIIGILARAAHEAQVFEARHRPSDIAAALGSRFAIHRAGFSLVVERPGAYRTGSVVSSAAGWTHCRKLYNSRQGAS